MFEKILIVCAGNICRSPYAEKRLQQLMPSCDISSAGLVTEKSALTDSPVSAEAQNIAGTLGIDLTGHRARQVTAVMLSSCDLILAMSQNQIDTLARMFPESRHKVMLFGHWIGVSHIEDPHQKSLTVFQQVYSVLDRAATAWADKIGKPSL
ncbi:low molecular weight protein-tyrosine-phosphatase [Vibrio mangrovi]|uniref:protein-tyrosine-phosphatase n=1 Tax=Vibrio mangrovi TaxID=474394 RepID=A0A1Y6IUN7_9VIBR|nr:low molecular weight protein-tyrosine-phosphatase [Vibrio mangrovi]MDW6003104.1 low molecular weight protein-tyrosine-phosphatase [Vibrio mangrovi]SMS01346.1 Low molecular weight protein-tyrosine-phosphatase wzb [Vibrio mangrovi]